MEKVFVVRIKHSNGNVGYHSAWISKESAERQVEIRNRHALPGMSYFLEEMLPVKQAQPFWERRSLVWFDGSVGSLTLY